MDMVNSGVPYAEAGRVFGLTRSQVKHHVEYRRKLYGEVRRGWYYWPPDELTAAVVLSKKGIPRSLIAQLLGRTRQSVIGALWREKKRGKRSKTKGQYAS